jgi:hypothetical protein
MKSITQGITALVIKAVVIAIAGPTKIKSVGCIQILLSKTILNHLQEVVINHLYLLCLDRYDLEAKRQLFFLQVEYIAINIVAKPTIMTLFSIINYYPFSKCYHV